MNFFEIIENINSSLLINYSLLIPPFTFPLNSFHSSYYSPCNYFFVTIFSFFFLFVQYLLISSNYNSIYPLPFTPIHSLITFLLPLIPTFSFNERCWLFFFLIKKLHIQNFCLWNLKPLNKFFSFLNFILLFFSIHERLIMKK